MDPKGYSSHQKESHYNSQEADGISDIVLSQLLILGRKEREAKLCVQDLLASWEKSRIKDPHSKANGFSTASCRETALMLQVQQRLWLGEEV